MYPFPVRLIVMMLLVVLLPFLPMVIVSIFIHWSVLS